jgi:hypothetical protein
MRMFLESPFDPADFATFRRQEATLIVLNLAVLAALGARFAEQTAVLAWLQGRLEPLSPRAVLACSRTDGTTEAQRSSPAPRDHDDR